MIEKVFVEYSRNIDGEWGTFTRTFETISEAMDFISTCVNVYTFKIKVVRRKDS